MGQPYVSGAGDGVSGLENPSGDPGEELVLVNVNHDALSCFVVHPDMGEKELDVADSLFAVKIAKINAAKMSG